MNEELKHIDLIDKHLNGTLNTDEATNFEQLLQHDVNFRKEVAIYKKIYKRIEDKAAVNFKNRLNDYYKEYQNVNLAKPNGIYKKLIIISSIAAAIIFGIFLINNNIQEDQNPLFKQSDPDVVDVEDKDSIEYKEHIPKPINEGIAHEETKDTVSHFEDNTQLSIGGLKHLPAELVRTIEYPITLQYTFNGGEIFLFGDPSIASLQLQIVKNTKGHYFLKYRDRYYSIEKTTAKKPLQLASNDYSVIEPTQEKIKIKLKGIEEVSNISKNIEASFTGNESLVPTYFFEKKDGLVHLVIDRDLELKISKVYSIHKGTKTSYFLKIGKKLFQLNSDVTKPTPLKEVYILTNKQTQLFREDRELPEKMVYFVE